MGTEPCLHRTPEGRDDGEADERFDDERCHALLSAKPVPLDPPPANRKFMRIIKSLHEAFGTAQPQSFISVPDCAEPVVPSRNNALSTGTATLRCRCYSAAAVEAGVERGDATKTGKRRARP
jgi:hypothetical protein